MANPRRKPNRLPAISYIGRKSYFLTLCLSERRRLFARSRLTGAITDVLKQTCEAHYFGLYAYCFIPDHLHLLLCGMTDIADLSAMVRTFKGRAAAAARRLGYADFWQKGFYDRVIRSGEEFENAAAYVLMNPVRAGLVQDFAEWPHSGSSMLDWRNIAPPQPDYQPPWKRSGAG